MLLENQHPHNKTIMASVLGAPNVGKSSLINYLLGFELSSVTHKAQTTRNRFHCVFNIDRTEIILVDTPGLHHSTQEINKRYNEQARESINGADINLILVDIRKNVLEQIKSFAQNVRGELGRSWLVFTKSDKVENAESLPLDEIFEFSKEVIPSLERYFLVSSKTGDDMHLLTGALCDEAHEGYHLYNKGQVSNKHERFFVTEYIRQEAFKLLDKELPYELAVIIDDYKVKYFNDNKSVQISASILVNRPSQRAIVIGSKGAMIKEIGIRSRELIEALVDGKVNLNLHVKVSPRWQKNNYVLEEIGLPRAVDSTRVWRDK